MRLSILAAMGLAAALMAEPSVGARTPATPETADPRAAGEIAASAALAEAPSSKATQIDGLVTPFADSGYFSGVVLVSIDERIVYDRGFGFANAELGVPSSSNSRIGIASVTKPMTAVVLSRLIGEGRIALEDKLSRFLPEFPKGNEITIGMLAQHRAGIPHRVLSPELEAVPHTTTDMVAKIAAAGLLFEPGTKRTYSSAGYTLLARTLEIASGRTYSQLLQQYVFDPAGMKDSLEFDSERLIPHRAQDYLLRPEGWVHAALKDYSFLAGAGSVFATARDLFRFGRAMVGGVYGEAVRSDWVRDGVFAVNGRTNGHRASVVIDGTKGYGFVVLSNLSSGAFDVLTTNLSDLLEGREPSVPDFQVPKLADGGSLDLTEFEGTYDRPDGGQFVIELEHGVLRSGDIRIYPTGNDCFFDFSFFGNVCFSRDSEGRVRAIVWKGAGYELKGERRTTTDSGRPPPRGESRKAVPAEVPSRTSATVYSIERASST